MSHPMTTKRGLIPEDLMLFSLVEQMSLADDGRHLAYTVKRPHAGRNGYQADAYLMDLITGSTIKLTRGDGLAGSPAWSRDSSKLALAWKGVEETRLLIFAADGALLHSHLIDGAAPSDLDWAPDGKRLICVRWTETRRDGDYTVQHDIPAPTIRYITRLRYKMDGVGWVEDRFRQLWLIDAVAGELVQLTVDERDYGQPRWSWGGTRLAYTCTTREMDVPTGHGQVEILDLVTGSTRPLLAAWNGLAHSPQWRHDDGAIVFTGHNSPPPVNNRIFSHVWHHDLAAGVSQDLSQDRDAEVGNYCVADQRAALTNITVRWPGGRGKIYFLLTEQGACNLYSTTEAGGCHLEVGGNSVTFEYAPSAEGPVVYGQADPANPGDLYLLQDGVSHRLTDLNPWLRSRQLAVPHDYWYQGIEGAKVHAWEIQPLGFRPDQSYPLVLEVHCSQFSWDFSFEFQCLAAAGYVVAYFNQRGTTAGYGQAWTRASEGDQGGKDYEEIMLGVDDLLTRSYIDPERMGVTGGSCGGFLTNWIIGHTDRFKAAVTQRSVVNEISMFGTSDIGPEMTAGETTGVPWTSLETMWRQSPLAYVEKIHTPLLILHATEDHRCALEQAEQLYAALRWLKRPVEMVIFVGESHGLTRGGRPGNRIEHLKRIKGWFDRYL